MTDTSKFAATGKLIPERAMTGSLRDFRMPAGPDLLGRVSGFYDWQSTRRQHNLWPYAKSTATAPKTHCTARSDVGEEITGVNFASQDYLSSPRTRPSRPPPRRRSTNTASTARVPPPCSATPRIR